MGVVYNRQSVKYIFASEAEMKKALRMVHHSCFDDGSFERNLELVRNDLDVIDEMTMFTEPTHHGYRTLEMKEATAGNYRK